MAELVDIDHRAATIRWEAATVNVAEPRLATVANVDLTGRTTGIA
jgi:hypothetical protein